MDFLYPSLQPIKLNLNPPIRSGEIFGIIKNTNKIPKGKHKFLVYIYWLFKYIVNSFGIIEDLIPIMIVYYDRIDQYYEKIIGHYSIFIERKYIGRFLRKLPYILLLDIFNGKESIIINQIKEREVKLDTYFIDQSSNMDKILFIVKDEKYVMLKNKKRWSIINPHDVYEYGKIEKINDLSELFIKNVNDKI
jgi:hypothetical protein